MFCNTYNAKCLVLFLKASHVGIKTPSTNHVFPRHLPGTLFDNSPGPASTRSPRYLPYDFPRFKIMVTPDSELLFFPIPKFVILKRWRFSDHGIPNFENTNLESPEYSLSEPRVCLQSSNFRIAELPMSEFSSLESPSSECLISRFRSLRHLNEQTELQTSKSILPEFRNSKVRWFDSPMYIFFYCTNSNLTFLDWRCPIVRTTKTVKVSTFQKFGFLHFHSFETQISIVQIPH